MDCQIERSDVYKMCGLGKMLGNLLGLGGSNKSAVTIQKMETPATDLLSSTSSKEPEAAVMGGDKTKRTKKSLRIDKSPSGSSSGGTGLNI